MMAHQNGAFCKFIFKVYFLDFETWKKFTLGVLDLENFCRVGREIDISRWIVVKLTIDSDTLIMDGF